MDKSGRNGLYLTMGEAAIEHTQTLRETFYRRTQSVVTGATPLIEDMASPAQYLPNPSRPRSHEGLSHNGTQLAPIDRAVRCLDRALDASEGEDSPAPEALRDARTLLSQVSFWVDFIPDPAAIFAFDGGVEVAWKAGDRHLRLYCSPVQSKSYIYASRTIGGKTEGSEITHQVDVFTLADALRGLHP